MDEVANFFGCINFWSLWTITEASLRSNPNDPFERQKLATFKNNAYQCVGIGSLAGHDLFSPTGFSCNDALSLGSVYYNAVSTFPGSQAYPFALREVNGFLQARGC